MAISLVQKVNNGDAGTPSLTGTFTMTGVTAGNDLVLVFGFADQGNTSGLTLPASSVSDTNGSGWVADMNTATDTTAGAALSVYRQHNAPSGSHTVTVSCSGRGFTSNLMLWAGWLSEVTPITLDKTPAMVTTTTTTNTTNSTGTLSSATEIAFAGWVLQALTVINPIAPPGAPWNLLATRTTDAFEDSAVYQIVSATTALSATATSVGTSGSIDFDGIIITYQDASGGSTTPVGQAVLAYF